MSLKPNTALTNQLLPAPHQVAWAGIFSSVMGGAPIRFRCKRDPNANATDPWATGTEFLNIGMTGAIAYDDETGELRFGALSGTTINTGADLSTGAAVFRIESGVYALDGTIGLAGSGKDITINMVPAASIGYALSGLRIRPPSSLPLNANTATIGSTITTMAFQNTATGSAITDQVVTFGHVFKRGTIPAASAALSLVSGNTTVPTQLDVKATHPDGSVRHAIISAVVPSVAAGATDTYNIVRVAAPATAPTPAVPADFAGLDSVITIASRTDGLTYSASLAALLAGASQSWLNGGIVSEWHFAAPLKTSAGVEHPSLTARFEVRAYKGKGRARIDVQIENTKFSPAAPVPMAHVVYDITLTTPGNTPFAQAGIVHYPTTRFRKTFWWGSTPPSVHIRHNAAYLIATKALPNYMPSLIGAMSAAGIAQVKGVLATNSDLFRNGYAEPHMPNTGGRPDIGILPAWDVVYLLDQGPDAKANSITQNNLMGGWSCQWRDPATGQPLSPVDFPNPGSTPQKFDAITNITAASPAVVTVANHSYVPGMRVVIYAVTGDIGLNYSNFVVGACTANTFELAGTNTVGKTYSGGGIVTSFNYNEWDNSHVPAVGYVPYMVTGDRFHLETMQFYATRIAVNEPMHGRQLRAQAWGMRDLAHAAYLSPDSDRLKAHYRTVMDQNFTDYKARYLDDPNANKLGAIVGGSAWSDPDATGTGSRTWQDDFITQSFGHILELGFTEAAPMFAFKAKYPVSRMNYCRMLSIPYTLHLRNDSNSPVLATIEQVYARTYPPNFPTAGNDIMAQVFDSAAMAAQVGPLNLETIPANSILGYADGGTGYVANMQPALAYAATHGIPGAAQAWLRYQGRSVKQSDYDRIPEFAIEPRA